MINAVIQHLILGVFLTAIAVANNVWAQENNVLPDPTRPFGAAPKPLATGEKGAVGYLLQAIIKHGENRKAMINGKWIMENQQIEGAKVNKINEYSVVLNVGGRTRVLSLHPSVVTHSSDSGER